MNPWLLLVLAASLLQSTWVPHLTAFGVHPNLVLVVVVGWSLLRGGRDGLLWAAVGGLHLDLFSAAPFGTFTISLLTVSFLTGLIELSPLTITRLLPVGVMLVASPLFHFFAMIVMQSIGWEVAWSHLRTTLLPAAILDSLLMLPLFPVLRVASLLAGERAIEWG